jgi:hypothetical protein
MSMSSKLIPFLLTFAISAPLVAGCASDSDSELVGTWNSAQGPNRLTFEADGDVVASTLQDDRFETSATGSWNIEGDLLHVVSQPVRGEAEVDEPEARESATTFYVKGDKLAVPAFLPVGQHQGAVGTWRMRLAAGPRGKLPAQLPESTIALRADHTVERTSSQVPGVRSGTWELDERGRIKIKSDDEFSLELVDDAVLAIDVSTRLP